MVKLRFFLLSKLQQALLPFKWLLKIGRPLCMALPIWAMAQNMAYAESWKVNLQDADIKAFINEVASITNKNFVLDPRLSGNVTVISNRALSKDEVYQLFLGVMQVNGIAAIPSGSTIKLVPDNIAKQTGIEVDLKGKAIGEGLITRVVYLKNLQANEVLTVIRPLMPQSAHAAVVSGVNALVLSDRADSLNELMLLIDDLDSDNNSQLTTINLNHVDAESMLDMIGSLVGMASGGQSQGSNQLKLLADPTGDRLLVKGNPQIIAEVQKMVEQLDTIPSKRLSGLRVFRLKYASATHIAQMLRGLLSNQSLNSAGASSTLESASLDNASKSSIQNSQSNTGGSSISIGSNSNKKSNYRPFSIIADETQNAIVVNANPELMLEIETAINQLDTRRAQVLIQAAIVEVSGDDVKQLGVQWALGNANSGYGVVNFNQTGISASSLAAAALSKNPLAISKAANSIAGALLGLGNSDQDSNGNTRFYGAILQALESTTSANLLSMPSIQTLDNEKASILVGQNVPFVTGSYTTSSNSSTNPFQTIDRKDIGINLNVIPHIGDNGTIRLEVSQEVSSVVPGSTANSSGLITNKSLINTTILADDQQTIALGGLLRDNSTKRQQKVPGLGNVPVIGRLFRTDDNNSQKSNLIIFLQPTILRDGGAVASITERKYNQMRVMQLVIDKNGTIKKIPIDNLLDQSSQNSNSTNVINNNDSPVNKTAHINLNGSMINHDVNNIQNVIDKNYELMPLNPLNTENYSTVQDTPKITQIVENKEQIKNAKPQVSPYTNTISVEEARRIEEKRRNFKIPRSNVQIAKKLSLAERLGFKKVQ